jgi:hypothetical protein
MKEEEINKRIAEFCGWTECRLVARVVLSVLRDPVAYGIPPNGTYEIACPNYSTDLNAMHEAERFLIDAHLLFEYGMHISNKHHDEYPIRATARERAEAFLRTLGKWEEAK